MWEELEGGCYVWVEGGKGGGVADLCCCRVRGGSEYAFTDLTTDCMGSQEKEGILEEDVKMEIGTWCQC